MDINSNTKSGVGLAAAIAYFTSKSWQVLLPVIPGGKYDLVVDDGRRLLKIQCKYTTTTEPSGAYVVPLRTYGGWKHKHIKYSYKKGDFDLLFATCGNGDRYLIPAKLILVLNSTICVGDKYKRYKV